MQRHFQFIFERNGLTTFSRLTPQLLNLQMFNYFNCLFRLKRYSYVESLNFENGLILGEKYPSLKLIYITEKVKIFIY